MTVPDNTPPPVVPAITDRRGLTAEYQRLARVRKQLASEGAPLGKRLGTFLGWAFARLMALFPARIITHYMFHGGPLMAAGLAYQLLFASTALLVIGFSLLGMILGSDSALQQSLVQGIGQAVPGLLDVGDGRGGVIPLALLENTAPFTVASGIASGVLVFTAWRWIAGIRLATRRMFELPPAPGMPIAAVPRDLAWLAVIGILLLSSAAISVFASGAVETVTRWLEDSGWIEPQAWLDGGLNVLFAVVAGFVVDLLMSFALVRGVSQLKLHRKALLITVLVGAIGSQLLRFAGGEIIARTTNNPYLFSFAVLVGVLLWFNLYGQILLFAAASGAVVQADIRGARAQPERESRAVTVVAASSLPTASRGHKPYGSVTANGEVPEDRGRPADRDGSTAIRPGS
ncbi:MAG: YihY/virulence factor BrkB family protein [Kocuria sp.]|nr:YihY/virulence factor BrkB family protein [Kocuria sp.]